MEYKTIQTREESYQYIKKLSIESGKKIYAIIDDLVAAHKAKNEGR